MDEQNHITKVSAAEFKRHFGRYRDEAQRGPVAVTNHGRVSAVLISASDYAEYARLSAMHRQAGHVRDLPHDILEEMADDLPEAARRAQAELDAGSEA